MLNRIKALVIVGFTFSSLCWAGHEVGNGGNGIQCVLRKGDRGRGFPDVISVELLDFYEARIRESGNFRIDLGESKLSPIEKVEKALSRLRALSNSRGTVSGNEWDSLLDQLRADFAVPPGLETSYLKSDMDRYPQNPAIVDLSNARFIQNIELTSSDDAFPKFLPSGCTLVQIATQSAPQFPGDKYFTINGDLWSAMDTNSRAGLLLHELIYRWAIKNKRHTDSRNVRYFVSQIVSPKGAELSPEEFDNLTRLVQFH